MKNNNRQQKTAVVYDKWLESLGGGEVVACSIARILRDEGYAVTLVGGKEFDTRKIHSKLHIDLKGVTFKWVWNDEYRLKMLTRDVDVFFNTSFMDYTHGMGKKSFYYTHFPTEAYMSLKGYIFNFLVAPLFTHWINRCEFVTPKNETIINGRYGYVLEKHNALLFTHESRSKRIVSFSLFYENYFDRIVRETEIAIENADVYDRTIRVDPHHNILHYKYFVKAHSDTLSLKIHIPSFQPSPHHYPHDRVILLFPKTLPQHILDTFMKRIVCKIETRMRAGIYVNVLRRMDSYTRILANSHFTQTWIQKYWRRKSTVIYPPVTTLPFTKKSVKKNMICSIGRFFVLGHGKKQEIMIDAFKKMYDRGTIDWELHLVGSVDAQEKESMAFIERLNEQAHGYPIYLHLNASYEQMKKIVSESRIYWHATGYGEDEQSDPVKFEHFGISPVEAISAGCIPLLYKGGGLPEIIHGLSLSNAHLYTTIDELVEKTRRLIKDSAHYDARAVALRVEKLFSLRAFEKALVSLLKKS